MSYGSNFVQEMTNADSEMIKLRASAKYYQVFLTAKEKVLVSLMRRKIQPAAFIDALAAVKASELQDTGPSRRKTLAFLRRYENERHKPAHHKDQHHSIKTAVSLVQLYRATEFFIMDLTRRSNFYLRRCEDPSRPPLCGSGSLWRSNRELLVDRDNHYVAISDTEEARLQRAFYRYELYIHIFGSGMVYEGKRLWELPSASHFFLANYQHWEVEELACVDNYIWFVTFSEQIIPCLYRFQSRETRCKSILLPKHVSQPKLRPQMSNADSEII